MTSTNWIGYSLNGRYQITELLGQGGMSAVYKATDPNLRRTVAIKLIHAHLSSDPEFVRRFEGEAAAVAQLRHPHIVQVYDFDHDGETYYIVFEFVPGETLGSQLNRFHKAKRTMPIEDILRIGIQVGQALDYAHQRKLVHRDIKPANILMNVHNEAILTDFGIVKITGGTQHTAAGAVLGTAQYMSPEQIRGASIDPRSDIYSLGVMLFEMAGGRPPFAADSAMTLMMMHIKDPVPDLRTFRPNTPPLLIAVIERALAKDPEKRYQTIADLVSDLERIQEGKTIKSALPVTHKNETLVETSDTITQDIAKTMPDTPIKIKSPDPSLITNNRNQNLFIGVGVLVGLLILFLILWLGGIFKDEGERPEEILGNTPTQTSEEIAANATDVSTPISEPTDTVTPTNTPTLTPSPTPTELPAETPDPYLKPIDPVLGSSWIRAKDDMVMLFAPAGTFQMGADPALDTMAENDELPEHEVAVESFWIDQTEVTNAQFAIFTEETGYLTQAELDGSSWVYVGTDYLSIDGANWRHPEGPDSDLEGLANYPVTHIAWNDAAAYCSWADATLPTESQWEYAAAGPENFLFPWGNAFDGKVFNFCDSTCEFSHSNQNFSDEYAKIAPVASYVTGASWIGAMDMIGNVWEWTIDFYSPYPGNTDPITSYDGEEYVLRGGSWVDGQRNSRITNRTTNPLDRYAPLGFRCVLPDQ